MSIVIILLLVVFLLLKDGFEIRWLKHVRTKHTQTPIHMGTQNAVLVMLINFPSTSTRQLAGISPGSCHRLADWDKKVQLAGQEAGNTLHSTLSPDKKYFH